MNRLNFILFSLLFAVSIDSNVNLSTFDSNSNLSKFRGHISLWLFFFHPIEEMLTHIVSPDDASLSRVCSINFTIKIYLIAAKS